MGADQLGGEVEVEDRTVEEEHGTEGLVLGGGRDVVVDGEGSEEGLNVVGGEL